MTEIVERNRIISFILNHASPGDLRHIADACEKRGKRAQAMAGTDMRKMAGKSELLWAVDFILKRMAEEDLILVNASLARRMEGKRGMGGLKNIPSNGAAQSIGLDMKQAYKAIHKGARLLAADIILLHNPEIPGSHLEALLDAWVPPPGRKKIGAPVPLDVMLAMIEHFVAYATGSMKAGELKQFPAGWAEKYWEAFSTDIRKLIASYLYNEIERDMFRKSVKELLLRG